VFGNRELRIIFGLKNNEVSGGWKKLHNKELHNVYSSPRMITMTKSKRMRWAGHVARTEVKMNANRILVGKPEGKRPLVRHIFWGDDIKIYITNIGFGGTGWIDLARDRAIFSTVMNLWVP
jgi:hypothetical protein